MILHLASTRMRPLIHMYPSFSCPNHSKFLTIPLPAHLCASSNSYVPPYIMRTPFPMCTPLAVRTLLVEQIPLYLMAFSCRPLPTGVHLLWTSMLPYKSHSSPLESICILWKSCTCLGAFMPTLGSPSIPWGFHACLRALCMCPRACVHVLRLMCVPCGVHMYLGASVHISFRSMYILLGFIRTSFRFVLTILNPCAPFLDPCALLLDLCINY